MAPAAASGLLLSALLGSSLHSNPRGHHCGLFPLFASATVQRNHPILSSGLRTADNASLGRVLRRASLDADVLRTLAKESSSRDMAYNIFRGTSTLRTLSDDDLALLRPSSFGAHAGLLSDPRRGPAFHRAAAVLLVLRGNLDAAHEVLLGITPGNLKEAEYAATHRGETTWADDHPLTDGADLVHAAVHRIEGSSIGEGNHTGYDNAKYWIMGGPKLLETPADHPVRSKLADRARRCAPRCVARGVVAPNNIGGGGAVHHRIIAGGGRERTVTVPAGTWDGVAFIDLCRMRQEGRLSEEEAEEISDLETAELLWLLKCELIDAGFGEDEEEEEEVK